ATDQALEDVIIENCGFDVHGGTANYLAVVAVNTSQAVQNIHIRGNRMFDSAILGQRSAQQRQYILLLPCDNCWVENNHLSEGGRIKVRRPGQRLFINNNVLEKVNDNAITVVDGYRPIDATPSADIHIEDNVILDPLGTGVFFGVDGETWTDPLLTTLNIHVARNQITGDWRDACITGTLPANAEKIHVVNNICTKTGPRGTFTTGIRIGRVNGSQPPAQDILVGFNTITAHPGFILDYGGIFVVGHHSQLRIVG